jgi:hypothetical protein
VRNGNTGGRHEDLLAIRRNPPCGLFRPRGGLLRPLAFLVLPAFYVLEICDAEGDVLLSFVPSGQFSHNFLLGSAGSNLGYCRNIAAAMLYLRDQ